MDGLASFSGIITCESTNVLLRRVASSSNLHAAHMRSVPSSGWAQYESAAPTQVFTVLCFDELSPATLLSAPAQLAEQHGSWCFSKRDLKW